MTESPLKAVLADIDAINAEDPNLETDNGNSIAKELLYSQRMTTCLLSHWPDANEQLQIAVRAQHIKRWALKRTDFEAGRAGYMLWRKEQGKLHGELTRDLMLKNGYSEQQADEVAAILRKEKLKSNPLTQTLEDVACLVFICYYFDAFSNAHDEPKVIDIVQKTWRKMSDKAHNIALKTPLPAHLQALVAKALA